MKRKFRTSNTTSNLEPKLGIKTDIIGQSSGISASEIKKQKMILQQSTKEMNANRREDDQKAYQWKDMSLKSYMVPSHEIHNILKRINDNSKDKGFEFYFLEGAEFFKDRQISLMLFGKLKTSWGFIEAKVTIKNPKRQVFIFPRKDESH